MGINTYNGSAILALCHPAVKRMFDRGMMESGLGSTQTSLQMAANGIARMPRVMSELCANLQLNCKFAQKMSSAAHLSYKFVRPVAIISACSTDSMVSGFTTP